jgi:hypothetical protein
VARPVNILLLIVPTGSPSLSASSDCVRNGNHFGSDRTAPVGGAWYALGAQGLVPYVF